MGQTASGPGWDESTPCGSSSWQNRGFVVELIDRWDSDRAGCPVAGEPVVSRESSIGNELRNACPAIDVVASTTTAGASCAGGAASGSPTCTFTCANGYSLAGSGTIACDANGERVSE